MEKMIGDWITLNFSCPFMTCTNLVFLKQQYLLKPNIKHCIPEQFHCLN